MRRERSRSLGLWAPLTVGALSTAGIDTGANFLAEPGHAQWWWLVIGVGVVGIVLSGIWGYHAYPHTAAAAATPETVGGALAHHPVIAPSPRMNNGLGVAALVTAVAALVLSWSVVGGVVLGVIAAAIGFAGYRRARRGQADNGVVAVAGIVLGLGVAVASPAFLPVWMGLWNTVGGDDYVACVRHEGPANALQHKCVVEFFDD